MAAIQRAITQRRKPPQDIEKDNFERQQAIHVQKAINNQEGATKEKHLRAIILGTFKYQGGITFWNHASKLSVQGHPIVCWKFCHVVYKLLREGHSNFIRHSQKYHTLFVELGKLWGHLKDGYGPSIAAFTRLIVQKLNFHKKNTAIPGNLNITKNMLADITQNDINSYFEVSVDMLDYMDEILSFEEAVFGSLDRSRSNSMTLHGQCKLTPIIICLQDSAALYDNLVKVLFQLHAILPADTLSGHRSRFLKQYRALQVFYKNCQNLQYFKNLIQVPNLPENPPNFLVESELASHRAPVVTVVPEAEPAGGDDLDTEPDDSVSFSLADVNEMPPALPPRPSSDRDKFDEAFGGSDLGSFAFNGASVGSAEQQDRIDDLMLEIDRLQRELNRLKAEHKERVTALMNRIKTLEEEVKKLVQLKTQLEEEQAERNEAASQHSERTNAMEEKFRKMKDLYSKIREEHVTLIRANAKTKSELASTQKALEEKTAEFASTQNDMAHLRHERQVAQELQKSADDVTSQLTSAKTALLDLERTNQELTRERCDLQRQKASLEEQLAGLNDKQSELEQERIGAQETIQSLEARLNNDSLALKASESRLAQAEGQIRDLQGARKELEELRERLLRTACTRGVEAIRETLGFLEAPEMVSCRGSAEFLLSRVDKVLKSINTISDVCAQYVQDSGELNLGQAGLGIMFADSEHIGDLVNMETLDSVVCVINSFSALICDTILQGKATSNSASNIDLADELMSSCKLSAEEAITFLDHLSDGRWDAMTVVGLASSLLSQLNAVRVLAEQLKPSVADVKPEEIGDLIDQEMQATAEAIRAAEEKFHDLLEKSRAGMTGVQLEVHERILDSCTQLMKAIKVLVEKSKVLQREIVAEGRGTATAKEFYKQHHSWTEGLISAAKTVGLGASTLVDAADRVVSGGANAKFEELTVCSQEIAASTAQLVVASRVKANPRSFSLSQLTDASRAVSRATGNVVACVKTASEQQDEQDSMNFAQLSLTQAKRMEMNSQVKVLELEAALEKERKRLGELRKQHYHGDEDLDLVANPENP